MSIFVRVAAVLLALLAGLIVAEIALRVFGLAPSKGVGTVTKSEFDRLPGIFSPGQRVVDRRIRQLPHLVTINSLGYRGSEIAADREQVPFRIVVLGDSFTFGDFVDDPETLPARLESVLSKSCSGVEVINGGVPGSGIVTQEAMFERALALEPNLVILIFTANDITDLIPPTPWDRMAANRRAKSRFPVATIYPVARRTALWNLGLQVRGRLRAAAIAGVQTHEGVAAEEDAAARVAAADAERKPLEGAHAALRDEYADRLVSLHERALEVGIPFQFVIYPSHHSVSGSPLTEEAWVEEEARLAGVPTLNLLPALLEAGLPADSLYLLPLDGHPSPRGYDVAAVALGDALGWFEAPEMSALCD